MNDPQVSDKTVSPDEFIATDPAAERPEPPQDRLAADLPDVISGANPLVAAANPILNLVPQLRVTARHPNPAALRDYLIAQTQAFEQRARQAGVGNETVIGARYCLCTVLDETAAQTPWGGSGSWQRHSLLVTFHNETSGGEKFFRLLSRLAQNPQQHKHLLELMYYCLAMGFEGRFRVIDNGRTQLEALKQRLVAILDTADGEPEKALSPHWKGEAPREQKLGMYLPVWVLACIAGLLAMLMYLWFVFGLARNSDDLFGRINALRFPRAFAEAAPPKPAAPRLAGFLESELREGLVSVRDEADRSVVTLVGDGLFESGSATLQSRFDPVIARIADALNAVSGNVLVTGHTDNVAIRTLQFPSNWQLSQARADSVKKALAARLAAPERLRAAGRAADEPVAPNDTPANRAKNRRVEIILLVAPENRDR